MGGDVRAVALIVAAGELGLEEDGVCAFGLGLVPGVVNVDRWTGEVRGGDLVAGGEDGVGDLGAGAEVGGALGGDG